MNQPLRGETPDFEEPKYKLHFRSKTLAAEKEISTAQVQFWKDHAESFVDSLEENGLPRNLQRVDLLTNEYHPQHVQRLDEKSHGLMMEKSLEVLN